MNMLVQPAPLPEEMDRGYLGRIMRINGYRFLKDTVDAIAEHFGKEGQTRREVTTHELLSCMAGMTTEHFAQRHTTMPLRRGITSYLPQLVHGSPERTSLLFVSGTLRKYPAAFFCEECVRADIHFHGTSYWRRDLQTPGQLWCPKHEKPLSFAAGADPFLASPAAYIGKSEKIPQDWVTPAIGNAQVERFLDLAAALYDRTAPLDVALITPLLRDMGSAQGFKANASSKQGTLVSDRVKELFPEQWLSTVFHEVVAKTPGTYLHQVDGVLYLRKSASSVIAYLLVLSVLFGSADQAVCALVDASNGKVVPSWRPRLAKSNVPDAHELLDRYVAAKGGHSAVAQLLELPLHTVRKALLDLGLPNLPEWDKASDVGAVIALKAYYLDKLSYTSCLEISGMTEPRFDALMRRCGPKMAIALERMSTRISIRPRARQVKGLLPSIQKGVAANCTTHHCRETLLQN
ncbi:MULTISPECIES: TniQ family protein [unclassified Delftia]|uniref:TniQ family protein n=1 Tax=unclassified Delftia TaxID=2613839 RepID=UPI001901F9DE|nr:MULTISPECIES: TniQ family protein [unclassified Delftia]MBK0114089.1 TniQ family protein [Delftia sp. S65]MBK0117897.1 TniQ family protein [Delftia sp. S67]MBK0129104.1 TniQ family protein [Delftia sp. S66]